MIWSISHANEYVNLDWLCITESIYGGSGGGEGGGGGGGVRSSTKVTITNTKQTKKETQEIYDQLMRDDVSLILAWFSKYLNIDSCNIKL